MELTNKLTHLLQQAVDGNEIAGGNLLVLQNGKEVAYTQAGYADKEKGVSFGRDTIARIYSMSKPVTAAAAMVLMERGQLDLGENIANILPAYRDVKVWENGEKVAPRRGILVKDLLNMTSGLPYPGTDEPGAEAAKVFDEAIARLDGKNPMTTRELADRLAQGGLTFHPGSEWMYGSSADVLGAVIEAVSGMSLADFVKEALFEPLEMNDTAFYVPQEKQPRLAQVYEKTENGMALFETNNLAVSYTMHRPAAFQSGGAGLVSTVDDYAKFATMLLNGGKWKDKQVLQPATVEYMTKGKLLPWQQDSLWHSWESLQGYGYSNLLRIMEEPGMALLDGWKGEYGWDGWLGTYFCNSPENKATVLMFVQRRDAGTMEVTRKIRNVITAYL